jgi:hypothetical protein
MTKRVRVENADTSTYVVLVEVWDKGQNGNPDILVRTVTLQNPCDMANDDSLYLTSTRYLIVREA